MSKQAIYSFEQAQPSITNSIVTKTPKTAAVPFLLGDPGIGKSAFIESLASLDDVFSVHTLAVNTMSDRADLTGLTNETDQNGHKQQVFFPHADIRQAMNDAENHPDKLVVLFFDEVNRGDDTVMLASMSIVSQRKIGTEKFPDNLRLIAAGNDSGKIEPLDSASVNRFKFMRIIPQAREWLKVVSDLNPYVESFMNAHPQLLVTDPQDNDEESQEEDDNYGQNDEERESFRQFATPRSWESMSNQLNNYGITDNPSEQGQDLIIDFTDVTNNETSLLEKEIHSTIGFNKNATAFIEYLQNQLSKTGTNGSSSTNPTINFKDLKLPSELVPLLTDSQNNDIAIRKFLTNPDNESLARTTYQIALLAGTDTISSDLNLSAEMLTRIINNADSGTLLDVIVNLLPNEDVTQVSKIVTEIIEKSNQNSVKTILNNYLDTNNIEIVGD